MMQFNIEMAIAAILNDNDYEKKYDLDGGVQDYVDDFYNLLMSLELPRKQNKEDISDLVDSLQLLKEKSVGKLSRDISHALSVTERYDFNDDNSRNALEDAMHEIYEDGFRLAPYVSPDKQ